MSLHSNTILQLLYANINLLLSSGAIFKTRIRRMRRTWRTRWIQRTRLIWRIRRTRQIRQIRRIRRIQRICRIWQIQILIRI